MNKENIISIDALTNLYVNSLRSSIDSTIFNVEGFYHDNSGKLYGKFFYDRIIGKGKNSTITIQIDQGLKSQITSGNYCHFQGILNKGQNLDSDSKLSVYFRVTKILKQDKQIHLNSDEEYDLVRSRHNRERPLIEEKLLNVFKEGIRPTIAIISGEASTAIADYKSELIDSEFYNVFTYQCNLLNALEVIKLLEIENFAGIDLIVVIRGGGVGLDVFNDIGLVKKIIEKRIPFITGIGHKDDVTLIQKVADKAFATPTAVGAFLQNIVNTRKNNLKIIEEKDSEIKKFQELVTQERIIISNQETKYKRLLVTVITIALVFLFYKYMFG